MLSLLGSVLGFGTSFLPKVMDFFQDKSDKAHELKLMSAQIDQQKALGEIKLQHLHVEADIREGEALLRQEVRHVEGTIARVVKAPLTENQFSSLVSFVYNVGSGNFYRSTCRQKLSRLDYEGAADELPKWRRSAGRILPGLVRRRVAERNLFLS